MANPQYPSHPSYTCPKCFLTCKTGSGLTRHNQTVHRDFTPISNDRNDEHGFTSELHPFLNGMETYVLYTLHLMLCISRNTVQWKRWIPFSVHTSSSSACNNINKCQSMGSFQLSNRVWFHTLPFRWSSEPCRKDWSSTWLVGRICYGIWRKGSMEWFYWALCYNRCYWGWQFPMESISYSLQRSSSTRYSSKVDDGDIWTLHAKFLSSPSPSAFNGTVQGQVQHSTLLPSQQSGCTYVVQPHVSRLGMETSGTSYGRIWSTKDLFELIQLFIRTQLQKMNQRMAPCSFRW